MINFKKIGDIVNHFRNITAKGLKNVRNKLTLQNSGRSKLLMDNLDKNIKKYFETFKIIPFVIKKLQDFVRTESFTKVGLEKL